jgi:hypothetical protein
MSSLTIRAQENYEIFKTFKFSNSEINMHRKEMMLMHIYIYIYIHTHTHTHTHTQPPLWSSGQSSRATDPEVRVRFPALQRKVAALV